MTEERYRLGCVVLHALSAMLFVALPWWSEKTSSSSHTITAYSMGGWAENTHSAPMPRYPLLIEAIVYMEVVTAHSQNIAKRAFFLWPLAQYFLILHLYWNACNAAAWSDETHNTVSPSSARIVFLVLMQLSGLGMVYTTTKLDTKGKFE